MKQKLIELLPMIRRYAYSLTGSMPDADDLLQTTVERALTRKIPEDIELVKWLFRVCRNLWIDEYRSRKVRQQASEDPEMGNEQIIDGERALAGEIELNEVTQAMQSLPEEQRSILSLVAMQGMAYKDVASTLGVPIGTVMSRLARARVSLSETLNPSAKRAEQ